MLPSMGGLLLLGKRTVTGEHLTGVYFSRSFSQLDMITADENGENQSCSEDSTGSAHRSGYGYLPFRSIVHDINYKERTGEV
jgi:hypothetical protein